MAKLKGSGRDSAGAKADSDKTPAQGAGTEMNAQPSGAGGGLMFGTKPLANGTVKVGLQLDMSSGANKSSLMVPDVSKVKGGNAPVYITAPVVLEFAKLKTFLDKKLKVKDDDGNDVSPLPPELNRFMDATTLSLNAFYYSSDTMLAKVSLETTSLICSIT